MDVSGNWMAANNREIDRVKVNMKGSKSKRARSRADVQGEKEKE